MIRPQISSEFGETIGAQARKAAVHRTSCRRAEGETLSSSESPIATEAARDSQFTAESTRARRRSSDEQIARAVEIDPFNPFTQMLRGIQRGLTGRYDEAIGQMEIVPPNPLRSVGLSWQYFAQGNLADGLAHYVDYFELLGDQEVAAALTDEGVGPQAAPVRGAEIFVERSAERFVKPNNIVHLFSWGGEIDRAVEWMERSCDMRDHEVVYMSCLSTSEGLRNDPRFRAILRRLDLPLPEAVA